MFHLIVNRYFPPNFCGISGIYRVGSCPDANNWYNGWNYTWWCSPDLVSFSWTIRIYKLFSNVLNTSCLHLLSLLKLLAVFVNLGIWLVASYNVWKWPYTVAYITYLFWEMAWTQFKENKCFARPVKILIFLWKYNSNSFTIWHSDILLSKSCLV